MVKVRMIKNPSITGEANRFNTSTCGEVTMGFDGDGGMDSVFISDLEVLIKDKWILLSDAFGNHDIITDDFNTEFFEPINHEERFRGYRL